MNEKGGRDLAGRTKKFALAAITLYSSLPSSTVAQVLGKQLLRSATSVGAHYREAVRAKSVPDFVSKIEGALQELEEAVYWLELLTESGTMKSERLEPLAREADELLSILVTVAKTAKSRGPKG